MEVRNKDAELAVDMAVKLIGKTLPEETLDKIWDKCHESEKIQNAVQAYLVASFRYAPTALHKLHTLLMEEFSGIIITNCYSCEEPTEVPSEGVVHPLCPACQDDFSRWMDNQL
jgi:hypothetical protein